MIQHTRIVLDIEWNNQENDHPAIWDWRTLLDLDAYENVTVIEAD